jgi:EAL domain-containing protein (putative c-di-GMP-specific phosphodiesterase class I)
MEGKILAVANAGWQDALREAAQSWQTSLNVEAQSPADAVIKLASMPTAYQAVAVEEAEAGPWFDTLLDLTLGDTDRPIPLLTLGTPAPQNRLTGTPELKQPFSAADLRETLRLAAINSANHVAPRVPEAFSDVESIRIRYQPVIRLADMRPTTVEILARIQTESGALVGPDAIIAAMTNGEYAMSLSGFIVQRALREHRENDFTQLKLNFAFNLPLDAMLHPGLLDKLKKLHVEENIAPTALRFELTETKPVTDLPAITRVIETLHNAGYKIALDDITPFTPNLKALLDLPFRAMKLDRSVTIGALSSHEATAKRNHDFVRKITQHTTSHRRAVIAEGIETELARQLMKHLGVSHGQGYLFARPLPAGALYPWLTQWPTVPGGGGLSKQGEGALPPGPPPRARPWDP